MTSTFLDGIVVCDDSSRRAEQSACIRVNPWFSGFAQKVTEQHYR